MGKKLWKQLEEARKKYDETSAERAKEDKEKIQSAFSKKGMSFDYYNNSKNNESNNIPLPVRTNRVQNYNTNNTFPITNNINRSNVGEIQKNTSQKVFEALNPGKKLSYTNNTEYELPTKDKVKNILRTGLIEEVKQSPSKLLHIAKSTIGGGISGTAGIAQASLSQSANQQEKGSKSGKGQTALNILSVLYPNLPVLDYNLTKEFSENFYNTLNDKEKNTLQKAGSLITEIGSYASNQLSSNRALNAIEQIRGKISPSISKKYMELYDKISNPVRKMNQKIAEEREGQDILTQKLGEAGQSMGNMAPSLAVTALTKNPTAGMMVMGESAKGQATDEALQKGADLNTATKIGDVKKELEIGTEMLTGGLKFLSPVGSTTIDNAVENLINNKIHNRMANFFTKQLAGIGGEIAEETISDVVGTIIDKGTVDPDATYTWNDWWNTVTTTALSTAGLNTVTGGYTSKAYKQNAYELQQHLTKEALKQNIADSQVLTNEEKTQMTNYLNNNDITEADFNAMKEKMGINPVQEQAKQEITSRMNNNQQVNNVTQEQISSLVARIDKSNLPNEDKLMMKDYIQNNNVSQADIDSMNNVIDSAVSIPANNELVTNQNFKNNVEARKKYTKYKNDTGEYNSKAIDEVLDLIPENRNGNRTVKQWLQVAKETGTRIADLSNEEIERIAYKSWFDVQPSKNITKYDRQTKSTVGFQKLTSDEWVNEINKAVNEARANNQTQDVANNQEIQEVSKNSKKDAISKEILTSLVESAKQQGFKYKDMNLSQIQKALDNKGIKSRFDETEFSNENEGAKWKLTRNEDGTVTREIILNPKANEKTVVQEMAIHELTHDIVAKNTKTSEKLYNEVKNWLKNDTDYKNQLENLKEIYGEDLAEEEAIAKTLQTKFGNQEEINSLVNYNPSMARKIYDWVVDKLNKITGGRIEKLYWEDVKNKFERAYSEQGNYNKSSTMFSISQDGKMQENGKNVTLDAETGSNNKTLLAIHNLTADKLKGVLELGGFPVPSIAITNPDINSHDQFGDISIIFNKETINPANKANEVYDRDVWSPVVPEINYDINNANIKEYITKNIDYDSKDPIVSDAISRYMYESNLADLVNRSGIDNTLKTLKDSKSLKYFYKTAVEKGDYKPIMKQANYSNSDSYGNKELQKFLEQYNGEKPLNELNYDETLALSDTISDIIREKLYQDAEKLPTPEMQQSYKKLSEEVVDSFKGNYNRLNNFIYSANSMQKNGINNQVIDEESTLNNISNKVDQVKYNEWIDNTFGKLFKEAKKGIRNNKDLFTPSGNRRGFNQLYDEYNLYNLVKTLTKGKTKAGQKTFFEGGFGKVSAELANQFKSIEDIKNSEYKLKSNEEIQPVIKELTDKFNNDLHELVPYRKKSSLYKDDFAISMETFEDIQAAVQEFASKNRLGINTFKDVLDDYSVFNTNKIPNDLLENIIEDLEIIKNIPTDYFEAKPQRAVGFDEIDAIVIPSDLNTDLKQQLKDRGIKTIEYNRNNENEKSDIIKSLNDYKFSKTTQNFDEYIQNRVGKQGTRTTLGELTNNNTKDIISEKSSMPMNEKQEQEKVAQILEKPQQQVKEKDRTWAILKAGLLDKGIVFEELSHKTKDRELQSKWDYTLSATARGQNAIGNARYEFDPKTKKQKQISKSLEDIRAEVGDRISDFNQYMYHLLNIDRMTLEERFGGDTGTNFENNGNITNKPVFSKDISADISRGIVEKLENKHSDFKDIAQDVYDYNNANKQELVRNGVISQELSDKLAEMYPHYVPIKRVDVKGSAIKVPLDTNRTGINSPLARATGGNSDIQPLFETMADRTMQTYRAGARNNFGVELLNTLNSQIESNNVDVDTIIDEIGSEDTELLKEGKNGENPTFTVFNNGEKTTFEITKDMYDALKPISDGSLLNKKILKGIPNKISNLRRGVLTEYNPLFSITNALKDAQDVIVNSQHTAKTFSKFPEAYSQILKKGYWFKEYVQNGGEQNSYFKDGEFTSDKKVPTAKKALSVPLNAVSNVNNIIEMAPRLAEYIASREAGRSVETSMLDASRVTTNFKAGGDITKFANRNGATFLNASVQGFQQQIRNIKEANVKGLKGYAVLAGKYTVAGVIPAIINSLIWKDDKDYEDLQDYVKDNYYCIAKLGDGKFIRIPKGRMVATLQKIVSNIGEYMTDDKKLNIDNFAKDFWEDLKFGMDNVAPNNPLDNNVISPIIQAITNKSWYGEDIVPSRLQKKPDAQQYDETTDSLSKWLGEKLNKSPYKINYLLDQYSGGVGDIVLPMMTKQAENNAIEDKFTTDSVMKSKYPGKFFELKDQLETNNVSDYATDEDKLKYKYINEISSELSDLYNKKREIQNSNMSDKDKKAKLKEVQKDINIIAKDGIDNVGKIKVDKNTATIDDKQYYKYKDEWTELSDKDKEKAKNISLSTFADYRNKVYELTKQKKESEENIKSEDKIQLLLDSKYSNKEKEELYKNYIGSNDSIFNTIKSSGMNIDEYLKYRQKNLNKEKKDVVIRYLNSMNVTGNQRLLLYALHRYKTDNNQKNQLVKYVKNLDMNNEEKLKLISKFSGFKVYKNGKITY